MLSPVVYYQSLTALVIALALTACSKSQQTDIAPTVQPAPTSQSSENNAVVNATAEKSSNDAVVSDERLGIKWGDDVTSEVTKVDLKRLSTSPFAEVQVRYANKAFSGKSLNDISLGAGEVSFSMVDDSGQNLPIYRAGVDRDTSYYLSAKNGQAYQLHYPKITPLAQESHWRCL